MSARILAAAAPGYLLAARKKVGAKLRGRAEPNKALHASLKGVPNEEILENLDLDDLDLGRQEVQGWFEAELAPISEAVGDLNPATSEHFIERVAEWVVRDPDAPVDFARIALEVTSRPLNREN